VKENRLVFASLQSMNEAEPETADCSPLMGEDSQGTADNLNSGDSDIFILMAGEKGSGKSTALCNIFNLDREIVSSPHSITKNTVLIKISKNSVNLTVVDLVGFGSKNLNISEIDTTMAGNISGKDCILLLCLSVVPSYPLSKKEKNLFVNLHRVLNKKMWEKCVILLTFSDTSWRDEFAEDNNEEEFMEHVNDVAQQVSAVLRKCDSNLPQVKSVFEERGKRDITVIPVGESPCLTKELLPGVSISDGSNWTDFVLLELLKKSSKDRRKMLEALKYGSATPTDAGSHAIVGVAVGAGIGATVGIVAGPLGAMVAAGVGAVAGGVVGRYWPQCTTGCAARDNSNNNNNNNNK